MENCLLLKEINKLVGEKFLIPTYQRGYRWDTKQVSDLLNDIYEFMQTGDKNQCYCLQPVVVLKRYGFYEVVDGQQRITTVSIIQRYLEKRTFAIDYSNRCDSKKFLENIAKYVDDDEEIENIDFYFMKNAYKTIKNWFETKIYETQEPTLTDEFNICLGKQAKVIWYEILDNADAESLFTRLNMGKIELTNAELIKALFLSSDNFRNDEKITYLRQLEIAVEWDKIENTLQSDKFWYFINGTENEISTRIEYIFDAIAKKTNGCDEFFTFLYFNDKIKQDGYKEMWDTIINYFDILNEWYEDNEIFHYIGFLIACEEYENVFSLVSLYKRSKTKSEFINVVKACIKRTMSRIYIEDLSYDSNSDAKKMEKALLLFNVITVQTMHSVDTRFPFESYVKNKWSLEHIHAQNAKGLNRKEQWVAWIDDHIRSFERFSDKKYKDVVKMLTEIDRDKLDFNTFEGLFIAVSDKIKDDYGIDLDTIDNIALLDRDTNSALNNEFFDVKRKIILDRDKNGIFIPICTKNVFLKYYSEDSGQMHYWSETDRAQYLSQIHKVLDEFLPEREEVQDA